MDKTLLIKTIFEEPEKILITAPHGFGKSTNLNMVKRFLEIKINSNGEPKDIYTTTNYKLFQNNNLKVCKYKDIFDEHFGKYPVMFMDYSPLSGITNFDDLLKSFRIIIRNAYSQHRYLLQNTNLFTKSELKSFHKCSYDTNNVTLTKSEIKKALTFLSKVLYNYFKKQVFVLIDEFDAYEYDMIFQNNSDADNVITFIQTINTDLLQSNVYVGRSLLMGSFTVSGIGLSTEVNDIMECNFLRDHPFNEYYGITDLELDELLIKIIKDNKEREHIKINIVDYYKGYTIFKQNTNIYNTRSILDFLHNKSESNNNFSRNNYTLQSFMFIFSFQTIQNKLEYLLNGNAINVDITEPFSREKIELLRNMSKLDSTNELLVQLFFFFLFELGYLSVKGENIYRQNKVPLKISNVKMKLEFASILRTIYISKYNLLENDIDAMNKIINEISTDTYNRKMFNDILVAFNVLFGHGKYQSRKETGFMSILLVSFIKFFPQAESIVYTNKPRSIVYIIVKNHNGISFIIDMKTTVSETKVYRKKIALEAHRLIIKKGFINSLDVNSRKKVVYLGISCSYKRNISISYSYFFKEGDDLTKPITLTSNRKVRKASKS